MAAMYKAATGDSIDGVIQIDSMGLAALLRGIGPVNTPDIGQVNSDNAVALTLNQAYTQFPDRPVRQEYLGQVAEAAFRRLLTGDYPSLRELGRSLNDAATRRNLIFWSSHPDPEQAAAKLQANGSFPTDPDFVQLTVQNFSGNKLDYYVDTRLQVSGDRPVGKVAHGQVQVRVSNTAPVNGRPPYVFGPVAAGLAAGDYRGLVSVYLPAGASITHPTGLDDLGSLGIGAEGDRTVVSFFTTLKAGQSRDFALDLILPPRAPRGYQVSLAPVSRVRPTDVVIDLRTEGRQVKRDGPLLAPVSLRPS